MEWYSAWFLLTFSVGTSWHTSMPQQVDSQLKVNDRPRTMLDCTLSWIVFCQRNNNNNQSACIWYEILSGECCDPYLLDVLICTCWQKQNKTALVFFVLSFGKDMNNTTIYFWLLLIVLGRGLLHWNSHTLDVLITKYLRTVKDKESLLSLNPQVLKFKKA